MCQGQHILVRLLALKDPTLDGHVFFCIVEQSVVRGSHGDPRTTDDLRKIKIDIKRSKIHGNMPNSLRAIYCQNNMLASGYFTYRCKGNSLPSV